MSEPAEPVVREVLLQVPPDGVWSALTEAALLSAWFEAEVEIDPRPRGAVRFRFGDGSELRGVIHELDPRRRLGLRWRDVEHAGDPTTVVFELHPTEEGTRLVVTESRGLLAADLWVETVG